MIEEYGGKTAFESWTSKKPNLQHTRVFGSEVFVHVPKIFTNKFDAKAKKMYLVGYEKDSANYRVYDSNTRKPTVSRNVVFSSKVGIDETAEKPDPLEIHLRKGEAPSESKEAQLEKRRFK